MIVVISNCFRKMADLITAKKKVSSTVARVYLQGIRKYHRIPDDVVLD
jgi:hypothetical protein